MGRIDRVGGGGISGGGGGAPAAHASTHASGGTDPVTPAAIGAATAAALAALEARVATLEAAGGGGGTPTPTTRTLPFADDLAAFDDAAFAASDWATDVHVTLGTGAAFTATGGGIGITAGYGYLTATLATPVTGALWIEIVGMNGATAPGNPQLALYAYDAAYDGYVYAVVTVGGYQIAGSVNDVDSTVTGDMPPAGEVDGSSVRWIMHLDADAGTALLWTGLTSATRAGVVLRASLAGATLPATWGVLEVDLHQGADDSSSLASVDYQLGALEANPFGVPLPG